MIVIQDTENEYLFTVELTLPEYAELKLKNLYSVLRPEHELKKIITENLGT